MTTASLNSCIIKSLLGGHMVPELVNALYNPGDRKVRQRSEGRYWDYKETLALDSALGAAELARDVLGFHNTEGGAIVVGVTDQYKVTGIPQSVVLDTKRLRDKLRPYIGDSIVSFQDSVELPGNRCIWIIFIPKHIGSPQPAKRNGAERKAGKPLFVKGDIFFRDGDQTKRCEGDADVERVFRGFTAEHLAAYNYAVDEPYFRLLNPNYAEFIGRRKLIDELKEALDSRHPVVALDGLGGVGKTAIAIQAVRELYDDKKYLFLVSLSAKSRVWHGEIRPRRPGFAGLKGLLEEIAAVFPDLDSTADIPTLKHAIISLMKDCNGLLLVDNLEEIEDPGVFQFLSREVPAPVKVLVTSRVDKQLGSLTISVPAMSTEDAMSLLDKELDRLGYVASDYHDEAKRSILDSAGGVPLAIKWAAQIASDKGIHSAAASLRGVGPGRTALLAFCFATMYESLSSTAKDVARLIPYLEDEWRPITLSIALNVPEETISQAIYEISDRGLIYAQGSQSLDGFGILPLTHEFLSEKLEESRDFQQRVRQRFIEAFTSAREGFLLDWPEERRAEFLRQRAEEVLATNDFDTALKLVRLAQTWSTDVRLRFLEGSILYKRGSKSAGLAHMRRATALVDAREFLTGHDYAELAEAIFASGGNTGEKEAIELVMMAFDKGVELSKSTIMRFIACTLQRREYRYIVRLIAKTNREERLAEIFEEIQQPLRDVTFLSMYGSQMLPALIRLGNSQLLDNERQIIIKEIKRKIESLDLHR